MKRSMLPTCVGGLNSVESTDVHHISKLRRNLRGTNRSHREAERRRRERINAHLGTLRSLLPKSNTRKRDKASLLAEVVQRMKELSKQADDFAEADLAMLSGCSDVSVESCAIPGEFDEAILSYHQGGKQDDNVVRAEATVCCNDRAGLNGELAQVFRAFRARTIRAEMSTLDRRTRVGVVVEWAGGDCEFGKLSRALKAVVVNRVASNDGPRDEFSLGRH